MWYITMFREYMGDGLIVGWFLLSVVYLLLKETKKPVRILCVYMPIILLLLFLNPFFAKIVSSIEEVYWRILWLLPVTITIAYAAVHLYQSFKGKLRIIVAICYFVLIMISGSLIYQDVGYKQAENMYHMPQTVVDICDAIVVEGREVMALVPDEMLEYVRQYAPEVCMPYGREIFSWDLNELHQLMLKEVIDVDRLAELAKGYLCHYVILPCEKQLDGDMLKYDYVLFDQIDGYVIYKDTTMNFSLY